MFWVPISLSSSMFFPRHLCIETFLKRLAQLHIQITLFIGESCLLDGYLVET
jgi:hypothetical protein